MRRSLIDAGLGIYSVQYDPANMVDWGGYRVPETFTACFEADRLGVQIEVAIEDDGPVCVAISRLHHDSLPLTSERRFPLRTMVNAAIRGAAFEIVDVPIEQVRSLQRDARLVLHKNTPLVPDERGNVRLYAPAFGDREGGEEGAREVSARRPRSDEDWRRLAAAYRRAVASGAAPSGVIAAEFGVSRPTARKWVQHAREKGFLRPAVGRRAGEARAGPAVTRSRGS